MPAKAPSMATASNGKIRSPVQKYDKKTVMKGLELKMMKKMPKGMYFTARENIIKLIVPTTHRKMSVQRSSGVMAAKKFTFSRLTIIAEAHILKHDLKKTNS